MRPETLRRGLVLAVLMAVPALAVAQALPALTTTPAANGGTTYSLTIQTLLLMTLLSFIPAMVLMMTSFTRII
ncbi:MAG: flagellar biosynthetic protein FliP, partial [Betaproteobacteria bacterium HGW-Betaproteobacteria-19]